MGSNGSAVKKWRSNTKKWLVKCLGGKCNKCQYDLCTEALDFHHKDPSQKEFGIGKIMAHPTKWATIVAEVKKCVLLCNRCHRELHSNLWKLEEIEMSIFVDYRSQHDEDWQFSPKKAAGRQKNILCKKQEKPKSLCPICSKEMKNGNKTCGLECAGKKSWKAEWPSDEELIRLVKETNKSSVADILNVSETAVRKRLKKIELKNYLNMVN